MFSENEKQALSETVHPGYYAEKKGCGLILRLNQSITLQDTRIQ